MSSPVVDISHHNNTPNWTALAAGGVVGVIHKATEGDDYVDPTLFERARAAMDAGLEWSTYHFLRPGDMDAQIDFYLDTVDPVAGERVCLDHEDSGVSLADLEKAVLRIQTVRPDLRICVYSGHLLKEQLGGSYSDVLAKTSLWVAQYTDADEPEWPTGTWPAWSLWQWTDSGTVDGISAPVDCNRWNGTTADLLAWFGPTVPEPVPPEPSYDVVIAMHASRDLSISVWLNDEQVVDVRKETS